MKLVMERPVSSVCVWCGVVWLMSRRASLSLYRARCLTPVVPPSRRIRPPLQVLAGALLGKAEELLDRGLHPSRIADGFERACAVAVKHLETIGDVVPFSVDNTENLVKTAMTSLGSKMYVSERSISVN